MGPRYRFATIFGLRFTKITRDQRFWVYGSHDPASFQFRTGCRRLLRGSSQKPELPNQEKPVQRGCARDPATEDGEASQGVRHPLQRSPQTSLRTGYMFADDVLDVHDLVIEDDERQMRLVASGGVHSGPCLSIGCGSSTSTGRGR